MSLEGIHPAEVEPARAPARRASRPWLEVLLLTLAVAVCYANSLRVPFLFDDRPPPQRLDYSTRPLVWASFALNRSVSGADTWSYHVFNALVHLGCGLLLLGLVRRMAAYAAPHLAPETRSGLALVTALAWLCHPLQTESVTYLSQRAESMGAFFYLALLYAFLRSTSAARPRVWHGLALLALAAGFATKEIVVTAPFLLWLADALFVSRGPLQALKRRPGFYAALALATLGLMGLFIAPLLVAEQPWVGFDMQTFGALEYARTQPGVVLHYLRLAFWPHPLCFDYGWPIARTPAQYLPALLMVGVLVLASIALLVSPFRRAAWIGFAGAWFFVILAPTSSFVPVLDVAFEHRVYLSLAAVVLLVVAGGAWLCRRCAPSAPLLPRVLTAALVLGLAAATVRRNHDYRSGVTLMETAVACAPDNDRAHANLGGELVNADRPEEALVALNTALRLDPKAGFTYLKLGSAYTRLGDMERAREAFEKAVEFSGAAVAHEYLGQTLLLKDDTAWAAYHFQKALQLEPDNADLHCRLADVLERLQRSEEAGAHHEEALRLDPEHADAHLHLAAWLAARGEPAAALEHARRALELPPDTVEEELQLGRCLEALGRGDEALAAFRAAERLAPEQADPGAAIARVLNSRTNASDEERKEALRLARQANERTRGQRADILEICAAARAGLGQLERAAALIEEALKLPEASADPALGKRLQKRLEEYRRKPGQ